MWFLIQIKFDYIKFIQRRAQLSFQLSFEVIVSKRNFAIASYYHGSRACKIFDGKYFYLIYETPVFVSFFFHFPKLWLSLSTINLTSNKKNGWLLWTLRNLWDLRRLPISEETCLILMNFLWLGVRVSYLNKKKSNILKISLLLKRDLIICIFDPLNASLVHSWQVIGVKLFLIGSNH